jgi:hypothetical protein
VSTRQILDRSPGDGGPPIAGPPPKAVKIRAIGITL